MNFKLWFGRLATVVVVLAMCQVTSAASVAMLGSDADTYLRDETPRGGLTFMDIRGADLDFRGYLRFDLSSLGTSAQITSASLKLTRVDGLASRNDTIVDARFALYGLNNEAGNTPQNWDEAALVPSTLGTEDVGTLTGVTSLDHTVAGISESIVNGDVEGGTITVSGAPLVSFLQSRLADGGLTSFIISNDDATDRGYGLATKEFANADYHPMLTIEYIPEPTSLALAALGLAVVGGWRRRRQ